MKPIPRYYYTWMYFRLPYRVRSVVLPPSDIARHAFQITSEVRKVT